MEAVIFVGIQGSGKSTFYRERFFTTHIRINRDMLRTKNRERILVQACLAAGQPFVLDNTNVIAEERARVIDVAKNAGFRIIGYYFRTDVQGSLERNSRRTGREFVPVKGILGTYKRLQIPRLEEGYDELWYVDIDPDQGFIINTWSDEI